MVDELWNLLGKGPEGKLDLVIPRDLEVAPFPAYLYLVGRLLAWASRKDSDQEWKNRRKRLDSQFGHMDHRATKNAACWPYVAEFFASELWESPATRGSSHMLTAISACNRTVYEIWFTDRAAPMTVEEFQEVTTLWYTFLDKTRIWVVSWRSTPLEIRGRWSRTIREAGYHDSKSRLKIPTYDADHIIEDGELLSSIFCSMMHEWNYTDTAEQPEPRRICGMQAIGRLLLGWAIASGGRGQEGKHNQSFLGWFAHVLASAQNEVAAQTKLPPAIERIASYKGKLWAFQVNHVLSRMPTGLSAAYLVSHPNPSPPDLGREGLKVSGVKALQSRLKGTELQVTLTREKVSFGSDSVRLAVALMAAVKDSPTHHLDRYDDIKRNEVYPILEAWEKDFLEEGQGPGYQLFDNSYPPFCPDEWDRIKVADFLMQSMLDSGFSEKVLLERHFFWPTRRHGKSSQTGSFKRNRSALEQVFFPAKGRPHKSGHGSPTASVTPKMVLEHVLGSTVDPDTIRTTAEYDQNVADKLYGVCSLIATLIGLIDKLAPKRASLQARSGYRRQERVLLVVNDDSEMDRFDKDQALDLPEEDIETDQ